MSFGFIPPRWLHALAQRSRGPAARAFDMAALDPMAAQRAYLSALLARQAPSAYGQLHGFEAGIDPTRYAARVPLMTPEDLRPWVERQSQGERGLLSVEPPVFYGISSGTSGVPKLVPVTEPYRQEFQRVVQVAFWHLYRRFPQAFQGRMLYSVGPRRRFVAPDGNDAGAMSGYNFTEQPALVRSIYAWPYELFTLEDADARAHLSLLLAIAGDISLIAGVFPLPIVAMLRDLEPRAEALAHDLEHGTLAGAPGLTPAERAVFARGLTRRPDLARRVRLAMQLPVEERVAAIFPKLALVYCWTTATAGIYVPELKRRLGPGIAVRDGIYAATEAWCNVCMGDEAPGGPLAVDSVYYEFIPERAYEAGSRETLTLDGLQDGEKYVVVVSNAAGLYRYVIGDVVEVCGYWGRVPRVKFARKTGATSSLAGELLDETHATLAVAAVLAQRQLEATWFALVADPNPEAPGYSLHLELSPQQAGESDEALVALGSEVDQHIQALAIDYLDLRAVAKLRPLRVVRIQPGACEAWRARLVAAGAGDAQIKAVQLYGDPQSLPAEFSAPR